MIFSAFWRFFSDSWRFSPDYWEFSVFLALLETTNFWIRLEGPDYLKNKNQTSISEPLGFTHPFSRNQGRTTPKTLSHKSNEVLPTTHFIFHMFSPTPSHPKNAEKNYKTRSKKGGKSILAWSQKPEKPKNQQKIFNFCILLSALYFSVI